MKQTLIKDLMTTDVITLDKQQSMPLAQELMRLLHIRHLPVVEPSTGKLEGLVTHRRLLTAQVDVLTKLAGETKDDAQLTIPVSKAMTTEVQTITPDTPAVEALRIMLRYTRGCLPVIADDKVVGIVTSRDLLKHQLEILERAESPDGAIAGDVGESATAAESAPRGTPGAGTATVPVAAEVPPQVELRAEPHALADPAAINAAVAGIVQLSNHLGAYVAERRHHQWITTALLAVIVIVLAFVWFDDRNRETATTGSAVSAVIGPKGDNGGSPESLATDDARKGGRLDGRNSISAAASSPNEGRRGARSTSYTRRDAGIPEAVDSGADGAVAALQGAALSDAGGQPNTSSGATSVSSNTSGNGASSPQTKDRDRNKFLPRNWVPERIPARRR